VLGTRRVLLAAWTACGLLWVAAVTSTYWVPQGAGFGWAMVIVLGFSLGLILTLLALLFGVVVGWKALRNRADRTWANLLLVGVSIVGVVAQALYASVFFFGVL
jgi:hypothetical protein